MFSHIMIGANDIEASKKFYDATLGALGARASSENAGRLVYMHGGGLCSWSPSRSTVRQHVTPMAARSVLPPRRPNKPMHGTPRASPMAALAIEDDPGVREGAFGKLYLAYLRDPAGNKVCAMHRIPA